MWRTFLSGGRVNNGQFVPMGRSMMIQNSKQGQVQGSLKSIISSSYHHHHRHHHHRHHHRPVFFSTKSSINHEMSKTMSTATTTVTNTAPLFSKVLIANRGEISQRVVRTCRDLGIRTVAIYSTADAKAPFVSEADEAICIGPADSSESYLNVENVLHAIRQTGAEAVHPGYGFLSENADFCRSIENAGVTWLGPPVSAIQDMGDKIRSKEIADAAGVNTIPGYEGSIESLDHAVEVANLVGYPVLVKAAAGGGGKGMRTCYNDDEVREAYPMAKAEAKKFFADDRLLVEKYIENPHHIEFQVLCSPPPGRTIDTDFAPEDLQVVVFYERECSVQRRNQKVVEESPSCLLTHETRLKMVEQVKKLCQTVGYVSAGTVEWLVDEEQNFYFLEMNTRLQVEHPVTEAVSGIDLVEGMLWVGAGKGLPPNLQIDETLFPCNGHAIEGRIYAEDPLRGYLPSTGPLVIYKEPQKAETAANTNTNPNKSSYIRMDAGVVEGHVVSPYYDPMLSKIISYAPTRKEAIDILSNGLDQYVIEGVQHNARLINAVLRHPSFRDGDTPTSFLDKHIPEFNGVQLSSSEEEEMAVAVAIITMKRDIQLQRPPTININASSSSSSSSSPKSLIVRLGGMFGSAFNVSFENSDNINGGDFLGMEVTVQKLPTGNESDDTSDMKNEPKPSQPRKISIGSMQLELERHLAHISLDGIHRTLQILQEDVNGEIRYQMYGSDQMCLLQSMKEYKLSQHMVPPKIIDTSDYILSPMPGTLINYSIKEGDEVEIGQELCIIEAMKMQNVIRSTRTGMISKLYIQPGSTLMTDEMILDFVKGNEKGEASSKMEEKTAA